MTRIKPVVTFDAAAAKYIDTHQTCWSQVYIDEWHSTLAKYVFPVIGRLPIAAIDTRWVLKVLEPIWLKYPVIAPRVRSRIEAILSWGRALGLRRGENPAQWRGHLKSLLPNTLRTRKIKHFPALPYSRVGRLVTRLRRRRHRADHALELMVLTATRALETLNAKWTEFDLQGAVWVIPAERMKGRRPHRVPLSTQAVALLRVMERYATTSGFVFPGFRKERPLSRPLIHLRFRMLGYTDYVLHGLRSSFRDWAAERTDFSPQLIEAALSHKVKDSSEAAYLRSDMFAKRAKLMQAWADYCDQPSGAAVDMRPRDLEPSLNAEIHADMREDVFSLPEGDVSFRWPTAISAESYQDLKDWMKLTLRKIKRTAATDENAGAAVVRSLTYRST